MCRSNRQKSSSPLSRYCPCPLERLLQALLSRSAVSLRHTSAPQPPFTKRYRADLRNPSPFRDSISSAARTRAMEVNQLNNCTSRVRDVAMARGRCSARTSTLAADIAWRLCWTYRSCSSTKLSRSRRTTRRTAELSRSKAGARIRDFAERRTAPLRKS
ncbi:hypothetical protein OH77DRAFT_1024246 [Trametes cingulata]|nr:hypothetical protein OH77DRAFT_1024246 [Trametes cingulata]